ncbi:MAG: LAGLIDADG family homing endonuclease [Nitrososphaerota archaeon]
MSAEASEQQRRRRGPYLPREMRIKIYEDFLELRKQGLSYGQIIKEIKRRYNVTIHKSHCSYWCRGIYSPYNGIRIPTIEFLKPSEDLAYVAGAIAGDGYVYKKSKLAPRYNDEFVVGLDVKDKEFAQFFAIALAKVLKRKPPIPWQNKKYGRWVVMIRCKALYELFNKPIDIEKMRPFVEHCEKCICAFLRGFFDSEGCVRKVGEIRVYNTNYKLLEYVTYLLNKIGIETTSDKPRLHGRAGNSIRNPKTGKIYKTRKDVYYVAIRAKSNLMFYEKVGFTIERKRKRLEEYLRRRGLLPNDSLTT